MLPLLRSLYPLLISCLMLVVTACSSTSEAPQPLLSSPVGQRDLSGYWEKSYQRSDDFGNRFNLYAADIRRLQMNDQRGDLGGTAIRSSNINTQAINGLIRFTEELTRMPALVIEQDERSIHIEREEDFPLDCHWGTQATSQSSHVFGRDYCGWDGERLLFRMDISGGLQIIHQFSLSADASILNITTTVSSAQAALPLTISNFYQRYEPHSEGFDCTLTLTHSRVCRRAGAEP